MRWKLFMEWCLTISFLFVLAGDILLPQPYRSGSQQLKTNINHFLVGLLPEKRILDLKGNEPKTID